MYLPRLQPLTSAPPPPTLPRRARSWQEAVLPGTPASALSRPGPPARTLWAPPSPRGPTVNWKGLPGTCWPLYLTLTVCMPISAGTKRMQYVWFSPSTISASWVLPDGLVTWAVMSWMLISAGGGQPGEQELQVPDFCSELPGLPSPRPPAPLPIVPTGDL